MMIVGGSKKAVPLRAADRPEEFRPMEVSPEMLAVYERCEREPKSVDPEAEA